MQKWTGRHVNVA